MNVKLFLTSTIFFNKDITDDVFKHIDKPITECKVLFIPNQNATKEKLESRKYIDRVINWGFSDNNIYIFNKYDPDKSRNLDIDIITIGGGNTFETMKIIKDCSFDKDIIKYVKNGVIYIGGSCGSHIVTKNIKHVEKYYENTGLNNYDGLNLFNGILLCHYNEEREEDYNQLLKENKYNIYTLTNNEYLICNDKDIKKISI